MSHGCLSEGVLEGEVGLRGGGGQAAVTLHIHTFLSLQRISKTDHTGAVARARLPSLLIYYRLPHAESAQNSSFNDRETLI